MVCQKHQCKQDTSACVSVWYDFPHKKGLFSQHIIFTRRRQCFAGAWPDEDQNKCTRDLVKCLCNYRLISVNNLPWGCVCDHVAPDKRSAPKHQLAVYNHNVWGRTPSFNLIRNASQLQVVSAVHVRRRVFRYRHILVEMRRSFVVTRKSAAQVGSAGIRKYVRMVYGPGWKRCNKKFLFLSV